MLRPALFLAAALLAGCGQYEREVPEPLPVLGAVAEFQLTDQDGDPLGLDSFTGRLWLVNFIFTRCPSICPQMTQRMADVAREFRKETDLRFLSISVDPEFDTPAVLKAYAEERKLPLHRWSLASGTREELRRLCLDSFKLALGEEMDENGDITHSSRFILVDRAGRIRGYYSPLAPEDLERLGADLTRLLPEAPPAEPGD